MVIELTDASAGSRCTARHYVYEHTRNDTGAIFYVGKGSGSRFKSKDRNQYWKRVVAKAGGFTPKIIVSNVDEELALLAEIERIDQLKRLGVRLTNLTNGGQGSNGMILSEAARKILSEKAKARPPTMLGKRHSEETRHKIRLKALGRPSGMKGRKQSAEAIAKSRANRPAVIEYTPEARLIWQKQARRMSAARLGSHLTDEHKRKLRAAFAGKKKPYKLITDGASNKSISVDCEIPEGWRQGFTRRSKQVCKFL